MSEARSENDLKVIRVAVLVTGSTKPKDLSRTLDSAFENDPDFAIRR